MRTLAIFGAGRLGRSLARIAALSGRYRVTAVCCRSAESARQACGFIGSGQACTIDEPLPLAELNLLAVPDDVLPGLARRLASRAAPPGALVFHASGVLDGEVLASAGGAGWLCGSLHPAFSFADPARAVAQFAGTLCALDGEADALPVLQAFAEAIGGRPFVLAPGSKAAYHASLSVASNFLVTLTGFAQSLAARAGIAPELARDLLDSLMHKSLDNALVLGAERALTGPIARGDAATVAKHLAVLTAPREAALYRALGRSTLDLAAGRLQADREGLARLSALLADRPAADGGQDEGG